MVKYLTLLGKGKAPISKMFFFPLTPNTLSFKGYPAINTIYTTHLLSTPPINIFHCPQ